jgi:type VI secretion system secreted protein VgrG
MSLFAHRDGMKHIARAGKVEIQAQQDSIVIAADRDVTMTASQGDIVIAAKTSITLSCGGAYIRIADGKIEQGCAGDFTVKAGAHKWEGPARKETALPFFPAAEHTSWLKLDLDGFQGHPMAGVPYTLHFADGKQKSGTLDGNGMAEERKLPEAVTKVVYHNALSARDEPRPTGADLLAKVDSLVKGAPDNVATSRRKGGK